MRGAGIALGLSLNHDLCGHVLPNKLLWRDATSDYVLFESTK